MWAVSFSSVFRSEKLKKVGEKSSAGCGKNG